MDHPSPVLALVAVLTTLHRSPSVSSWQLPELHGSPQQQQQQQQEQHEVSLSEKAPGWAQGVG